MIDYEEIKKYITEGKGIITNSEFKASGISRYYIEKLLKDNIIEKHSKGVYVKADTFEDEYYIFQQKYKNVVFSYNTAMYFLEETEKTPEMMDVTVYKGYNVHTFPENINVHYTNKDNLYLGATKVKTSQGFEVMSYNLERILCDLVKGNNTGIDKEQTNKFIRRMLLDNKIDMLVLNEYAKKLKCEIKIRRLMEVLI